jgi:hypothetical protein
MLHAVLFDPRLLPTQRAHILAYCQDGGSWRPRDMDVTALPLLWENR